MGPRFLSFASTVDAFATTVGILVAIISSQVNAPAPDPGSEASEAQKTTSDSRRGSELLNAEVKVLGGVSIGELRDVLLDANNGQLSHVVVEAAGGDVALPYDALSDDWHPGAALHVSRRVAQQAQPSGQEQRLTQIMGKPVTDGRGVSLGVMSDVVFDARGCAVYGVVRNEDAAATKVITVPWSALEMDEAQRGFVIHF